MARLRYSTRYLSAETERDRKGSAPERRHQGNEHHCDEDEEDRVAKGDRLEGGLDQKSNAGGRRHALHSVERFAGQGVQRRPVRLLRRQKMSAGGGDYVCPPLPRRNEQQDAQQNRLRGKEERDFAVGKSERPGDLRGGVVAERARQDEGYGPERYRLGTCFWSGAYTGREFGTQQLFNADHRSVSFRHKP